MGIRCLSSTGRCSCRFRKGMRIATCSGRRRRGPGLWGDSPPTTPRGSLLSSCPAETTPGRSTEEDALPTLEPRPHGKPRGRITRQADPSAPCHGPVMAGNTVLGSRYAGARPPPTVSPRTGWHTRNTGHRKWPWLLRQAPSTSSVSSLDHVQGRSGWGRETTAARSTHWAMEFSGGVRVASRHWDPHPQPPALCLATSLLSSHRKGHDGPLCARHKRPVAIPTFHRGTQSDGCQWPPSLMVGSWEKSSWMASIPISLMLMSTGPSEHREEGVNRPGNDHLPRGAQSLLCGLGC